jgi:DNA recombination protein RmuC
MDEILIYRIIIGVLIVPILWLYFRRNNDSAVLEKEIEGLKKEKEGLENLKNALTDSLEKERNTTKEQLKAINKIDEHKSSISQYTMTTEERNKLDKENIDLMKNYLEKLTGSSRFQGDVGEKILQNILHYCGLRNPIDFICQEGDKVIDPEDSESLKNVRPDTLIRMGDSHLVVDCKVSLDNWKNWVNEKKDEKLKSAHLKKHLNSITDHIQKLSVKKYSQLLKRKVFPSTIMFIPFEAGYLSALDSDPDLGEKAYNKNIILAGPGNIMAIIKIVETIKSKEKQIENVNDITKSASKLYDKYATLKSYLKKVVTSYRTHGKNLEEAINNSWGGKDSLEKQMINLKNKHGLNATKNIETTSLEEDKIRDVNDPEEKGPFIN